jgi:hypothetical protein
VPGLYLQILEQLEMHVEIVAVEDKEEVTIHPGAIDSKFM